MYEIPLWVAALLIQALLLVWMWYRAWWRRKHMCPSYIERSVDERDAMGRHHNTVRWRVYCRFRQGHVGVHEFTR